MRLVVLMLLIEEGCHAEAMQGKGLFHPFVQGLIAAEGFIAAHSALIAHMADLARSQVSCS